MNSSTIFDIGEKRLISEFIRPLFNEANDIEGVGDDCAMLEASDGQLWLFSTDRVPADLISFRLGVLDYYGLGRYLACLNISDIAACGGTPLALLLNLGLPNDLAYKAFTSLCQGFGDAAMKHKCRVLGGDISSSSEISICATSIGTVQKSQVLTRRDANVGDTIFISKPIGITPAAFGYYLNKSKVHINISPEEIATLNKQFTAIEPLVSLGMNLSQSNECTSCMDNTDGLGQSLLELSLASKKAFVIKKEYIDIPPIVTKISNLIHKDTLELAFSAGADFALVGTLRGHWEQSQASERFGPEVRIVGLVDSGTGVYLETAGKKKPLDFTGWSYFSPNALPHIGEYNGPSH